MKQQNNSVFKNLLCIFSELPLSEGTLKGLKEAGYDKPTEIQRESIGNLDS